MIQSLQTMRFLAALAVVVYHATVHTLGAGAPDAPGWLFGMASIGAAGVHVFFVLSGFVMAHTAREQFARPGAPWRFFKRRILRIYPIFWITAALAALCLIPTGHLRPGLADALASLTLWPGKAPALLPPAWTLSYEMLFYLAFALVLFFPRRAGLAVLTIAFGAAIAAGQLLRPDATELAYLTNILLLEFLAGVWLAEADAAGRLEIWARRLGQVTIPIGLALLATTPFAAAHGVPETATSAPGAALIIAGLVGAERARRLPAWVMRATWTGESSYALYLVHMIPVFLMSALALDSGLGPGGLAGLILGQVVIAVLAGLGLHLAVERPLLAWLRTRFL